MKILVTGSAGFIGSYVCRSLLMRGDEVVGLDNINAYYDVDLKYGRLSVLGINREEISWYKFTSSNVYPQFSFVRMNLEDRQAMQMLFANGAFDIVINLAAQAGVRYSIENPYAYVESNINGFLNVLEGCRYNNIKHLVYASSSSVYGLNAKVPFSEKDSIAHPVSLYAATKKSNELLAYSYGKLYGIPVTGLRFFTVYGPMGRPDMAYFGFTNKMVNGEKIQIYNHGDMYRDFTYIDDIVNGVYRVMGKAPQEDENGVKYKIYNIGNNQPESLMYFVETLETCLQKAGVISKPAEKEFLPMQPGDVYQTYADVSELEKDFDFRPSTPLSEGLQRFADWYAEYYKK